MHDKAGSLNFQIATSKEDETCATFVFHNETHTLGNSLRYIIMKKWVIGIVSLSPILKHLRSIQQILICPYTVYWKMWKNVNLSSLVTWALMLFMFVCVCLIILALKQNFAVTVYHIRQKIKSTSEFKQKVKKKHKI